MGFLLLDTATKPMLLGVLQPTGLERLRTISSVFFSDFFQALREELRTERKEKLAGLVVCEGPGSLLSLRSGKMLVDCWNSLLPEPLPVWTYDGCEWARKMLLAEGFENFSLVLEIGRNKWVHDRVQEGKFLGRRQQKPIEDLDDTVFYLTSSVGRAVPENWQPVDKNRWINQANRFVELLQTEPKKSPELRVDLQTFTVPTTEIISENR